MKIDSAICIENLWTQFTDDAGNRKIIHQDINLEIAKGEIVGLVGASGCGKTTLLREIMGLQLPSKGNIYIMGKALNQYSSQNPKAFAQVFGVLFQKGALFSALDVFDNIAFPLREMGIKGSDLLQRLVFMKLNMVGLNSADARLKPAELSGGMIKRVALARALILEPSLLLLDEPTAGLDPIASQEFVDLLAELHQQLYFTVVMVTHDLDVLRDLCTKVAVLADRQLVIFDSLATVLSYPHPFIKQFFHNTRAKRVFDYPENQHG